MVITKKCKFLTFLTGYNLGGSILERIVERAEQFAKEVQMIADSLADYNLGLCKDRTPLDVIQYDLACLERDLLWLYTELGRKIKDGI